MSGPWEKYGDGTIVITPKDNDPKPWEKHAPNERAQLDKEVTNENYRVPFTDTRIPKTGTINQFLISTGRGMVDLWAGTKQIVGADTSEQPDDLAQFKKLENEAPITSTIGRVAGQVAPTLAVPAGAAAQGVRALSKLPFLSRLAGAGMGTDAMVMGGLQGFINYTPEGESRGANAVTSALASGAVAKGLEAGGRVAGPLVGRGVDYLRSRVDDAVGTPNLATMAGTRPGTTTSDLEQALAKEGIDWSTLPQAVREGVKSLADDAAKAGAPVTPGELARVVRAQKLPGGKAELTKGQMTQDRNQLRTEFDLRRTTVGKTLDDQLASQDKVLADSLDVIKLKTGGATVPGRDADAGQKITKPLIEQLRKAQANVDDLYAKADAAEETLQKVDPTPLVKWVEDNFAAMHSAPAMKSLVAQLKKSGLVTVSDDGVASAGREPTIREMEQLRKAMVKWGKADGSSGHYMGEAKRVLDGVTEGKGGELYKAARQARISMREQFEDPGVINRLVSEKPTGERVTAFEDVFKKSVIDSSVDDLVKLRGQLLLPTNKGTIAPNMGGNQDELFPKAGAIVQGRAPGYQQYEGRKISGLAVRDKIPNEGSLSGLNYEALGGIREVQTSSVKGGYARPERASQLARELDESKEIAPLIVMVDKDGPYILEGAGRHAALEKLGVKSFPAKVVVDLDNPPLWYGGDKNQALGKGVNELRDSGVQAFKDLRAATMDFIKAGAITNADEVSHAGLKRAVESIGREKMEVLFGKNTANQIYSVLESAKDMKAVFNKSGVYNPGTASALVEWLDRISGIVGLGKAGTYGRIYASGAAKKLVEGVQQPKLVEQASKPVQAAMEAGAAAKDDVYRKLIGMYGANAGAKAAPGVAAAVSAAEADEQ